MQILIHGLTLAALLVPGPVGSQAPATTPPPLAQATVNTVVPVALPVNATVWLKGGGSTTGKVTGFDGKKQTLTLGQETIKLEGITKVAFDRKALAYRADGSLVIRGQDNAQAKPSTWSGIPLTAFSVKDPQRGQAQVNLAGVMKPTQLRGIRSVAVKSVYLVDELQFPAAGKMTVKVTPSDPR